MSKEQQVAAAARILEKEPLTAEEKQVAEWLKKDVGSYVPPRADGLRVCGKCGAEFEEGDKEKGGTTAMEKFIAHQSEHNPSARQWAKAHETIQATKPAKNQS